MFKSSEVCYHLELKAKEDCVLERQRKKIAFMKIAKNVYSH